MESYSKSRYYLMMGISVLCLVFLVGSVSYAFFRPMIIGDGSLIDVSTGKVKLNISEQKITAINLTPILDSTKSTKASSNSFTISRTDDSSLGACYSLYLVVEEIGANLRNKWFKYELDYTDSDGSSKTIEGNFGNLTLNEDGTANIGLLVNQEVSENNTSNSYTLRLWLSYDPVEDQSSILNGSEADRTFKAHINANGASGLCKVQGD